MDMSSAQQVQQISGLEAPVPPRTPTTTTAAMVEPTAEKVLDRMKRFGD